MIRMIYNLLMRSSLNTTGKLYTILAFFAAWIPALYILHDVSNFNWMAAGKTSDFLAQMTGAEIIRNGEIKKLYDYSTQFYYQQKLMGETVIPNLLSFRTPPTTAYLYALLPSGNVALSFWITVLVNLLCVVLALWVVTEKSVTKTFFIGTVSVFSAPLLITLIGAQPVGPLLLLLAMAFVSTKQNRPFVTGLLVACLFIKPNFLLAAPFMLLLLKNREQVFKYVLGLSLATLVLIAVNSLLYGKTFITDYTSFLVNTEGEYSGTSTLKNLNLVAVVHYIYSWFGTGYNWIVTLLVTITANLAFFYFVWMKRKNMNLDQTFAAICFALPILNIHTMYPDLSVQLLTLALLLPNFWERKKWVAAILLLLLVIELPYYSVANLEWAVTLVYLGATVWLLRALKTPADI